MLPHGIFFPLGRFVALDKLNGEALLRLSVLVDQLFLVEIVLELYKDDLFEFKIILKDFLFVFLFVL